MPLNLHPNAKAAASAALGAGLPHVRVENGVILESFTAFLAAYQANEALPKTGYVHEQMVDYVDDLPLVHFVTERLRQELSDHPDLSYSQEIPSQSLSNIPVYSDLEETAQRLVEDFDSLPWKYTFSLQLPNRIFPEAIFDGGGIAVGDLARVVKPDLLFDQQFPLSHSNPRVNSRAKGGGGLSLLLGNQGWEQEGACYQRDVEGFVGIYGGGNLVDALERGLESFFGLGLATRLFTYNFRYHNEKIRAEWIAHIGSTEPREFHAKFSVDEEIAEVLRHTETFRFENTYPTEQRIPWLVGALERASRVISSPKSKALVLSSKWFFDSFKGRDETLAYIRLMTTLEILLGEHADTSKASLGEILGNRLAYLIGNSHQDRADILSEFKKVYGVRSGILHHGKHRLRGDERGYISKLRKFCERAIEKEARLLLA